MFKFTICDPLVKDVIDRGAIPQEAVLPAFSDFPWSDMLAKMRSAKEKDICFSPSVGFENTADGHGIVISIVEGKKETVFYLFYKESAAKSETSELLDQTAASTIDILTEFVAGRYGQVRERFAAPGRSNGEEQKPWWRFW